MKKWFAITKWAAEDVMGATAENNIEMTEDQAIKWLEANEKFFEDIITQYGNEVLCEMIAGAK